MHARTLELEANKTLVEAENAKNLALIEEHKATIALLTHTKKQDIAASGGVDPSLRVVELQVMIRSTQARMARRGF